ncbi:MAG: hypothetical protein LLF78_02425 [Synergistaceae bacterium]|nr:hypothetical protein [Synergistaceae bacterium]
MELRILKDGPKVVNFGIEAFHEDQKAQNVPSVHVDWKPSAMSSSLMEKLRKLQQGGKQKI